MIPAIDLAVRAVNRGRAVAFRGAEMSAVGKSPVPGPVAIGPLGLEGDEQADRVHHGGTDMALHHYPRDHYAWWADLLGGHPLLSGEAAFGENISALGLTESHACVGDRYRLGSALVEISQPRKPCSKLNHRFGDARVLAEVVKSGHCGWYYRVIEAGIVTAGDRLTLIDRPHGEWSVARVFAAVVGGGNKSDPAALAGLADLPALSSEWRARAAGVLGE